MNSRLSPGVQFAICPSEFLIDRFAIRRRVRRSILLKVRKKIFPAT
jgi:hypothetical protein